MAAQHLRNRKAARDNVIDYAGYIDVPARPVGAPEEELYYPVETNLMEHHELVLETMARTSSRPYGRAIIMMPPGSAKTTYASVVFPSWYLGKNPGHRIVLISYGDDLAKDMGHKTRSIIKQERYKQLFNVELTQDSRAADHFTLTNESIYHAAGYNGDLPGRRAEGAICDDIIKGIAQAESQTERDNVWKSYSNNLMSRLLPGAWLVIIMTHWDEDDPCGRILPSDWKGDSGTFKGKDGLDWEVLCLQAQCETTTDPLRREIGEYMVLDSSGKAHETHWKMHQADARKWNALYQQRPRPVEGAYFNAGDMLVNAAAAGEDPRYVPIEMPYKVDLVFAVIDSAVKDTSTHDGCAVMFFGLSRLNIPTNPPLVVLDYDLIQIKGAFLAEWVPSVFIRLEALARECGAFHGSGGVHVEDKVSGTILVQQTHHPDWIAAHPEWRTMGIDSKLTALGKKGKANNVSGYVKAGNVKWARRAYERAVTYKEATRNHAWSQVLRFSNESKDNSPDDCLDTFTYGIAISLGNAQGY